MLTHKALTKKLDPYSFSPVVDLPSDYQILDFTQGLKSKAKGLYSIGRYNEKRPGMYVGEQYENKRDIHIGIDIGAPEGTPVKSFFEGQVFCSFYNETPWDYGGTIIVEYAQLGLFALYGHLSKSSVTNNSEGRCLRGGEVFAAIGSEKENGGWPPHLHFQLCVERPVRCDLPGVVAQEDIEEALLKYPDPQLVLGPLYESI